MTRSAIYYYLILLVYVSLWSCQLLAGHLTHSLIILTDSYINLYRILDISLGILHLRTQLKLIAGQENVRLFGYLCSFQFKRLPILGSFVNGLFLAALLMSAAIEGIQTCFHVSHLQDPNDEKSILLQHPITYPALLVGFALVGLVMQWCSSQAHRGCSLELASLTTKPNGNSTKPNELSVVELNEQNKTARFSEIKLDQRSKSGLLGVLNKRKSNESLPTSDRLSSSESNSQVSLKSMKVATNLDGDINKFVDIKEISSSVEIQFRPSQTEYGGERQSNSSKFDQWAFIRSSASPFALITCALIIYFINHEFVTEISDASLAILVVVLLFSASYPPMKKAGKVLLQTAPIDIEPDQLRSRLKSLSATILEVKDLHVWSLTGKSATSNNLNRIGTCHLMLDASKLSDNPENDIKTLIRKAKSVFLDNLVKCSTIQPVLVNAKATSVVGESSAVETCDHQHHHHHHNSEYK